MADDYCKAAADMTRDEIRKSWSGTYPPASQPGKPPAVRTGDLDRSIEVVRIKGSHFKIAVAGAPYALFLEWGTSKMAARPFMRPANEKVRKVVADLARQAMDRFLSSNIR